MDYQEAIDFSMSLAREQKLKDVDVVFSREDKMTIRVHNRKVEKVDQSTGMGLGIRVVDEGRTGIAYTERLAREPIERALSEARENARLMDPTEVLLNTRFPEVPDLANLEVYNPELENLSLDDLTAFGLEMEAEARGADPRVTAVPYAGVTRSNGFYRVVSIHGMNHTHRQNYVAGYCQALLEENGRRKTGGKDWAARNWQPEKAKTLGRMAVETAAGLINAEKIKGGALPIVLDEECAPGLLGMYLGAFTGEAAQKGQSRLKDRLGEQIAIPELDLLDDPHRKGAAASRYLDAEGTATRPLHLVEKGVFSNFLYHIESARKAGVDSTGHAGRGYSGGISTRLHNLVIPKGDQSLDELIAIPERCLLVTELEGAAGCNPLSGDISIGVQGYLVEGGQRKQPVDSVTIAGNFYDLLKAIRARGNNYQDNLTSMFIPPLLVDGLVVSS